MRRFLPEVRRVSGRWIRPFGRVHPRRCLGAGGWRSFAGAALYLLTFALASLAASARFVIGWALAMMLGLLFTGAAAVGLFGLGGFFGWVAGAMPSAELCGWVFAVGPLAFSLAAFVVPGREPLWRRWVGARAVSKEERKGLEPFLALFESLDPRCGGSFLCYVVDSPVPFALVRGRVLVLSSGMLGCAGLAGVLAHELWHLVSSDGRLTAALDRIGLWGDALGLSGEAEFGGDGWLVALAWGLVRVVVWVAGASWCLRCTRPLWAAYWRSRERAADAYAARLGQATVLADHLEQVEQPRERPRRYRFLDPREHDPVALRVERLRGLAGRGR